MNVGQRLKIRRNELGFTQDYVAAELGITRQTMSNWENGRSYPDIERIIRLSELYNLSLDELLKGDREMVKHLQENTVVNHFLKIFIVLLLVNGLLMLLLLANPFMNEVFLWLIFALVGANSLSLFYLIIKKNLGGTNYEPNSAHDSFNGFTFGRGLLPILLYLFVDHARCQKPRHQKSKILVTDRYRRTKRWRPAALSFCSSKNH